MCTVDLFPVPESLLDDTHAAPSSSRSAQPRPLTYFPVHPFATAGTQPLAVAPFQIPRRQYMLRQLRDDQAPPDAVMRIGHHLVTESSKLTPALVGEKFVEPTLVDYNGKKALVFAFGVGLFPL